MNARAVSGATPLHAAADEGHQHVAKLLLENGAAMMSDNEGWFPLHFAGQRGSRTLCKLLLDNRADVNVQDKEGWTPLHLVMNAKLKVDEQESLEVTGLLLEQGAQPNSPNESGVTPLMVAAAKRCDKTVELLVQSKADLYQTDLCGMSTLSWLQRLRPRLRVSLAPDDVVGDAHIGPDLLILRHRVFSIATDLRTHNDCEDHTKKLLRMAQCFLLIKMEEDARISYLKSCKTGKNTYCEGCGEEFRKLDLKDTIFICKTCGGLELCQECMHSHQEEFLGILRPTHEFMQIIPSEEPFEPDEKGCYNKWLDDIIERLRDK